LRRATHALRGHLATLARAIDIEGAFVITGTAVLAVGSGMIHPAAPFLVVGGVLLALGFALARPPRRA
jgi:hypothetical protein